MIFELYAANYGDYCQHLFEGGHSSRTRWKKDCYTALRRVGREYIKQAVGWVETPSWIDSASNELIKMGYKRAKPIDWGYIGGFILRKSDWKWKRIVGGKLFKSALAKNEKVEVSIRT